YTAVMGAKEGDDCPAVAPYPQYTLDCTSNEAGHAANTGIMYSDIRYKTGEPPKLCRTRPKAVTDGLSKTFLYGEQSWDAGYHRAWIVGRAGHYVYSGNNVRYSIHYGAREPQPGTPAVDVGGNDNSFGSKHPGGCHFSNADGSVHFFSENTAVEILQ